MGHLFSVDAPENVRREGLSVLGHHNRRGWLKGNPPNLLLYESLSLSLAIACSHFAAAAPFFLSLCVDRFSLLSLWGLLLRS